MKTQIRFLPAILFCLFIESIYAQVPQAIPYQAVARNNVGALIANQAISIRFNIHNISAGGTVIYSETHGTTTNALGLFNLNVGQGSATIGTFAAINWAAGAKFLEVEMDTSGGSTYTTMGTQQMMSVPYAQFASSVGFPIQTFAGFIGSISGSSSAYVFAGPTTTITITSTKKITGSASAMVGLATGSMPQFMDFGLCYQMGLGAVTAFAGSFYTTTQVTTTLHSYTSSYSVTLSPGTYIIGFGIKNTGPAVMNFNDYVNGWIMITD